MKKKIFTLFALGFLLSMVCGVVNAQPVSYPVLDVKPAWKNVDAWGPTIGDVTKKMFGYYVDEVWNATTPDEFDVAASKRLVQECEYEMVINLPYRMVIDQAGPPEGYLKYVKDRKVTVKYPTNITLADGYTKEFFIIPGQVEYKFKFTIKKVDSSTKAGKFDIEVTHTRGGPAVSADATNGFVGWQGIPNPDPDILEPRGVSARAKEYNSFATLPSYRVEYENPQTWTDGKLDNHIKGGTIDMLISIDEGYTWVDRYYEFTVEEIRDAMPPFWVKIPNSCGIFPLMYIDDLPYEGQGVPRAVILPVVNGINITYPVGQLHYARSGSDFVFYFTTEIDAPFTVSTDRKGSRSDASGGLLVEKQANGSWKVTIKNVQEAVNVSIEYKVEINVGNEAIAGSAVWAEGGQVFINSSIAGSANIFNATGALVKTVAFGAGETAGAALPAGIYVAVINGKTYKFVVK